MIVGRSCCRRCWPENIRKKKVGVVFQFESLPIPSAHAHARTCTHTHSHARARSYMDTHTHKHTHSFYFYVPFYLLYHSLFPSFSFSEIKFSFFLIFFTLTHSFVTSFVFSYPVKVSLTTFLSVFSFSITKHYLSLFHTRTWTVSISLFVSLSHLYSPCLSFFLSLSLFHHKFCPTT